ncbi:MAG: hypothetical protein IT497_09470 [Ottowia sp.]|nr:hypothetical protein [Ottowia sp.]
MIKFLKFFIRLIDGEFFLKRYPNGGTIIVVRSIYIAIIFGVVVFCLDNYFLKIPLLTNRDYQAWVGLGFLFSYTALYARFASQWGYLAALYEVA